MPLFELRVINFFGIASFPSWKLLYFLGILASAVIVVSEAKRLNLGSSATGTIFGLKMVLGEIFGKVLFWISHLMLHRDIRPDRILKWDSLGRIYFGELLGIILGVFAGVFIFKERKNMAKFFDVFLLGHLGFIFFYRIGNLANHSHIGKITTVPWGFWYNGQIRHDPTLYELISIAALFSLAWILRKKVSRPGILSLIIIGWVSLSRFITDFFRSNDLPTSNFHFQNGLTLNQVAYGIIFVLCIGIIYCLIRKNNDSLTKT